MKNLTWISDLKLRGSWGMLGNSNISPYQYQSTVNFAQMWYYLNDSKVTGALPTTPANPDVKWETQYSTDLGLDLSVLDSRLLFTVDYYYKKTRDLLQEVKIPSSTGFSSMMVNRGYVTNEGLEISGKFYVLRNTPLKWDIDANISFNKNKVGGLDSDQFSARLP